MITHLARLPRLPGLLETVVASLYLVACGSGDPRGTARESATPAVDAPVTPVSDDRPRLVTLGDSLTAGLGLEPHEAYPAVLQRRLDAAGLGLRVVNAGVSGDTSAGGASRLAWALEGDVRVLIVALGGNDALRALPSEELRRNLGQIIMSAKARSIPIILAGMEAPPNLGQDYTVAFRAVYRSVAKEHDVTLLPFLLEGVAGVEHLNQRDGIHPTAAGARLIADHLWPLVEPMARSALASSRGGAPRG